LHPINAAGKVAYANVLVVGSVLAGQRYLAERCGDGVAIASARRAAATVLAGPRAGSAPRAAAERPERAKAGSRS
ncbi:MAG TPA: hypothetical protein VFO73_14060, partial [Candidatus Limnocylindrales bacterium]|nr:hypothetical protein [Candidatus Limnocylindrales bacterium]